MKIDAGLLADKFITALEENMKDQYDCFRTEVRDTGMFVCGVHKGEKWISERSGCPEISAFTSHALYTLYDAMDSIITSPTKTSSNPSRHSSSSSPYSDDELELFDDYEEYS